MDKRNPWGGAATDWALESRGRVGTDLDDFLAAYTRDRGDTRGDRRRKDWEDPTEADEDRVGQKRKAGLGFSQRGEEGGDLEWVGMVAELVE